MHRMIPQNTGILDLVQSSDERLERLHRNYTSLYGAFSPQARRIVQEIHRRHRNRMRSGIIPEEAGAPA